jgi:hypothetical protein
VEVGSGILDQTIIIERSATGVEITWNLLEDPFSGAIEKLRIIMRLSEVE